MPNYVTNDVTNDVTNYVTNDMLDLAPSSMSRSQTLTIGTLSLLLCLVGISANLLSLAYFLLHNQNRCRVSNLLFKLINLTDLVICVAMVPVAVTALLNSGPGWFFGDSFLCNAWVFVW